jgi:urease subunit gamma/beta
VRLTAWEEERLLIFSAAELARRHRAAGLQLNAPESIALISDAMFEAARAGGDYAAIKAAGRAAVTPEDTLDGVRAIVDEVRIEVLMGDGTRLIVLVDPIGGEDRVAAVDGPGAVRLGDRGVALAPAGRARRRMTVRNGSRRVVRVSSHYPFERVNPRLEFDRAAATGFHLDLPAGTSERWDPGETKEVELVVVGADAE